MHKDYYNSVTLRYNAYNNLFLDLPFGDTYETGIYLPLLTKACSEGFKNGETPIEIISQFLETYFGDWEEEKKTKLLFRFIQYIEREVVLFDAIEYAAFDTLSTTSGTIDSLIDRVKESGKEDELLKHLNEFSVRIVLTAHPTQFYPSQVLGIITDLSEAIKIEDTPAVNALLHQLGKTPFFQKEKPSPYEEAVRLTWYLENVFYHTIPDLIMQICKKLGLNPSEWKNSKLFKVGFWPGGDRDGNPFVLSDTTLKVAARLREVVLKQYHRDLRNLRRRLTFRGVEEIIQDAEHKIYNALYYPEEIQYQSPNELVTQLIDARRLLVSDHNSLYLDLLDSLIIKVKVFGFQIANLDIRQDSRKHKAYWSEVTGSTDYSPESVLRSEYPNLETSHEEAAEWISTIRTIKQIQETNGEEACNRFIVSNSKDESDVLIIYHTVKNVWNENPSVDFIPLFESVEDLANASSVMENLFNNDEYKDHLQRRGDAQTIMLGFSDGTKDGGYFRANWSIFRAKEELSSIGRKYGIKIIFFDGRGGPPARGGGNTHNFYASLGDNIDSHEIQLTIQGQTISSNYGQPSTCKYNLEQLLTAGIDGDIFDNPQFNLKDEHRKIMDELAEIGYEKYTHLKEREEFVPYLENLTPLRFFGDTNIGSRPSRRGGKGKLNLGDLRAIPFVGSWGQMKQNVPGFYGVGEAMEKVSEEKGNEVLQNFYKESLFFRALLGNSMQSLEKANFEVTRYISKDKEFGDFWNDLHDEYNRSIQQILQATNTDKLMANEPIIRTSIQLRDKIVLPLVTMQQYGLQELRKDPENKAFQKLVIRTMFGIINATRNAA